MLGKLKGAVVEMGKVSIIIWNEISSLEFLLRLFELRSLKAKLANVQVWRIGYRHQSSFREALSEP
jgi:hypothetical protein